MLVQSQIIGILNELLNQSARLRKGGIQATYHCPFCIDKNLVTQKLEIALSGPKTGNYHCWRCNTKGKSFGSLLKKLNAPAHYREAIFKLTGDIRLARRQSVDEEYETVRLPNEFHPLSQFKPSVEYKNAIFYLKRRGVLLEDILRYNIGYCETGEYAYHVIIPSYDAEGNLNFFMGRRYYEVEGAIPHKKPEASMDIVGFECFVNYNEPLNLCEGVFDAIAIRNNAIPLFGKFPSKKLREKMILHGVKRVNLVLDSDAMEDSVKNYQLLVKNVPGVEVFLVKLSGKDPSKLGFAKTHELIRKSEEFTETELLDYKLRMI